MGTTFAYKEAEAHGKRLEQLHPKYDLKHAKPHTLTDG